jgi:hypothetical protein
MISPLLQHYRLVDAFIKPQKENCSPWHQDRFTGRKMFDRCEIDGMYHEDVLAPSLRVLFNIGPLAGVAPESRIMSYRVKGAADSLITTRARVVAMASAAAGSGCLSDYEHARFGDGVTLSLDMLAPSVGRARGGVEVANDLHGLIILLQSFNVGSLMFTSHLPKNLYRGNDVTREDEVKELAEVKRKAFDTRARDPSLLHCSRCGGSEIDPERRYSEALCKPCNNQVTRLNTRDGKKAKSMNLQVAFHHSDFDGTNKDCEVSSSTTYF